MVTYLRNVHDDDVFRALADPGRRQLLDALKHQDGQSLAQLCQTLPTMSRFGVMKHLKVLEEAHLVLTERVGRQKLHYLNAVPIREIHDRWISAYTEAVVEGLASLKARAESASPPAIANEGA